LQTKIYFGVKFSQKNPTISMDIALQFFLLVGVSLEDHKAKCGKIADERYETPLAV